jgi:lipopolysaccharide export system permease protein
MRIADRYILRRHAGPFAFGTGVVMFLFLMQFLVRYGEQLLGKGLPIGIILQLVGLNLAWMFVLAVPMGALFASVYVFGMLAADHEATALKSAGVSAVRMMRSVLLAALGLTGMLVWFNDRVLPEANHQAKVLLADVQRKRPTLVLEPGRFVQLEGYTVLARAKYGGMLLGVTLYDVARSGPHRRRLRRYRMAALEHGDEPFSAGAALRRAARAGAHELVPLPPRAL